MTKLGTNSIRCLLKIWGTAFALLLCSPVLSQQLVYKDLFRGFERRFALLDSLIFKNGDAPQQYQQFRMYNGFDGTGMLAVDSLINDKVSMQKEAFKAENGLLVSGQSYYRLDEGFGIDDEDALSRYDAKVQVELRWNFLSSSLVHRDSRMKELELKGELERMAFLKDEIKELTEKQQIFFRAEYDSLLSGVLKLRIDNLKLLYDAQEYLVSDRSIGTDDLLKFMDEKAIAERQLESVPKDYPVASQLVYPAGAMVKIDTAGIRKHILENSLMLQEADLQIELLQQQEIGTTYWRTLNISPFVRYSYYVRPQIKNSSNIDAGIAFQIPLTSQQGRKQKAMKAERMQKIMEKDMLADYINEQVNLLFAEIERANRSIAGELERIRQLRKYLALRKENYKGHIGEYNFLTRIKEYNHYLTCWENYYLYQYSRDCCIAQLQNYLPDHSVLEFCTIIN